MVSGLTHRGQYQSYALLCSLLHRSTLVRPLATLRNNLTYKLILIMVRLIKLSFTTTIYWAGRFKMSELEPSVCPS